MCRLLFSFIRSSLIHWDVIVEVVGWRVVVVPAGLVARRIATAIQFAVVIGVWFGMGAVFALSHLLVARLVALLIFENRSCRVCAFDSVQ